MTHYTQCMIILYNLLFQTEKTTRQEVDTSSRDFQNKTINQTRLMKIVNYVMKKGRKQVWSQTGEEDRK